jgi:hypothetical protein
MYKPGESGGPEAEAGSGGADPGGPDNVVDADFEEVDEKKRKGSH